MIRITITQIRSSPDGSTTTTIDDEWSGSIDDLPDRHRKLLTALHAPSTVDTADRMGTPEPVSANHAPIIVSTTPAPTAEWTGRSFFAWAKQQGDALRFAQDFGHTHGFPRRMVEWSPSMCQVARAAWESHQKGAVA